MDRTRVTDSSWAAAGLTPVSTGGQAMTRLDSSRSNGSSLSQTSQMSNMDMRGNASAFRTGAQATDTMVGVDSCLLMDADAAALPQVFWPGYQLGDGLESDQTSFPVSETSPLHVVPSQMQYGPDSATLQDNASPCSWASFPAYGSRTSSPVTVDDAGLHTQQTISPPNSSPEIPCMSPRYVAFCH